MDSYLTILVSILSAMISTIVTWKLSLISFKSERWWDKKFQVYSEALEALHNINHFHIIETNSYFGEDKAPDFEKIKDNYQAALNNIERAMTLGSFFFSVEANDCLSNFMKIIYKWMGHIDINEIMDRDIKITEKYIMDFIAIAKKDLEIKKKTLLSIVKVV